MGNVVHSTNTTGTHAALGLVRINQAKNSSLCCKYYIFDAYTVVWQLLIVTQRCADASTVYASSYEHDAQLVIISCNFILNGPAKSVVYIDNSNSTVDILHCRVPHLSKTKEYPFTFPTLV